MNPRIRLAALCSAIVLTTVCLESARGIQIGYSYSPVPVVVGGKLTGTYSLINDGTADESATLFTNRLPANCVFTSANATNGTFTVSNNVFSFRPDRLGAGETTTFQVVVTPVTPYDATNHFCWIGSAGGAFCSVSVTPVAAALPGPQLMFGRDAPTCTLLADGRALIVGGLTQESHMQPSRAAEVYNPASQSFSLVGSTTTGRYRHTSTLLANGMVLVAGGEAADAESATAELFDPVSDTFRLAGTLQAWRRWPTTTQLPNGDVILAGGAGTNTVIERLHLENGEWTASEAGHLLVERTAQVASTLPDGRILFAGGMAAGNAFAEIFDPETGNSQILETPGTELPVVAVSRGRILLHGYLPGYGSAAQVYDIASNTFTAFEAIPEYVYVGSSYLQLGNGDIVRIGGCWSANVDIFDLRAVTFKPAPPLVARHCAHSTVQLADGRFLLAGGYLNNSVTTEMGFSELYSLRSSLDLDFDGMDDEWELANGFDPGRREDAVEDADGDGHTNLQEYLAGTDPRDPLNVLKIEPPQIVGGFLVVRFPTVVGKFYRVEKSLASAPDAWVVVADSVSGNGGLIEITDPVETGEDQCLYRVMLLP